MEDKGSSGRSLRVVGVTVAGVYQQVADVTAAAPSVSQSPSSQSVHTRLSLTDYNVLVSCSLLLWT